MSRLDAIKTKTLIYITVGMACLLMLLLYGAWYWNKEGVRWRQYENQGHTYAAQLEQQYRRGPWFKEWQHQDVLMCVQKAAEAANLQITSYQVQNRDKEAYEIILAGSFYDIMHFLAALEAYTPPVVIASMTISRQKESEMLQCIIVV